VAGLTPFLVMALMERALEMEARGRSVIHLEIGEPDRLAPPEVREAAAKALESGRSRYTDSRGLLELREAIADDCARRTAVRPDPSNILVTSGTSPAMLLVFSLLLEPGAEVIVPEPYYACYPNFVRYCGGAVVPVVTRASDGFAVDPDEVKAQITSRTRAIVLASPANPTGAVQSREVMASLAQLGPPLVSDEIYHGLVYDGHEATSALTLGPDAFVLDGFSKRYAMTGFRLGWLVAPDWAREPLRIMQQNFFISASDVAQRAGIEALKLGASAFEDMGIDYQANRNFLVEGLRELGFAIPCQPQGAFYVLADARRFGRDSLALAHELLEKAGVAVAPGVDFGPSAEGMLRFSYAVSRSSLEEALRRLGDVLPELISKTEAAGKEGV
ncbi:MAG: pyridoxal phosphate-dependent aminotransferase, partial [Myxococcota bacterium]|nr:pyridoxal phosphate-dependent aminotransferase [Myxococcota bacterium]